MSAPAAPPLALTWIPGWLTTNFNDGTYFRWDHTTAPTNAKWFPSFDADASNTPANLPTKYYTLQVVADGSAWTWQWVYCNFSVTMPAGPLTLLQAMTTLYEDTKRQITSDQYQQITGTAWQSPDAPTLARAIIDNQAQYNQPVAFTGFTAVSPSSLYILA